MDKQEMIKSAIASSKPDFYEDEDCPECGDYMEKDKKTGVIECCYCGHKLKTNK